MVLIFLIIQLSVSRDTLTSAATENSNSYVTRPAMGCDYSSHKFHGTRSTCDFDSEQRRRKKDSYTLTPEECLCT